MRVGKGEGFTVPKCIFDERMPGKAFRLLCYLYRRSDVGGCCKPGYRAMRDAIADEDGQAGSDATVRRYLKFLHKRGWIFHTKRTQGIMAIYIQIPPRLRPSKTAVNILSVLSP